MGQVREAVPGSASRRCGLSASLVPRALGNMFLASLVIIGGAGGFVRGHYLGNVGDMLPNPVAEKEGIEAEGPRKCSQAD